MTPRDPSTLIGHFDTPEPGERVRAGAIIVSGWMVDRAGPVGRAFLTANGEIVGRAHMGQVRDDVGEEFPNVAHAGTGGWTSDIDLPATSESVQLALVAQLHDGSWFELPGPGVVLDRSRSGGTRGRAVFTIVQDEPVFLPLWLRHYGRHFSADDIYVLDHDTIDGSTSNLGPACHVVPVHRSTSFDHRWHLQTVRAFQRFLLRSYDTVLFADADEFVFTDPAVHPDLGSYIDVMEQPVARCRGYNVVHSPGEAPLSHESMVLEQRGWWCPSRTYSKPALARVPLTWSLGFHDSPEWSLLPPDPHLLLVHLHRVDYDITLARHRSKASRTWDDPHSPMGWQNRVVDDEQFRSWFLHGDDLDGDPIAIPERFRTAL